MCGIFAVFDHRDTGPAFRSLVLKLAKRQRHRGPDWNGAVVFGENAKNALAHERLSIVDPSNGHQPFVSRCDLDGAENTIVNGCMLVANGEIYNHRFLKTNMLKKKHNFQSSSDCEVIMHLYEEYGDSMPDLLDGDFAFVVTDGVNFLAARDPIGVVPLYQGWSSGGSVWFASEMKTLSDTCEHVVSFPPGYCYSSRTGTSWRWFNQPWINTDLTPRLPVNYQSLRHALERAVHKRMMTDAPFGVLLSGGLDSSLVASIMCRYMKGQQTRSNAIRNEMDNIISLVPTIDSESKPQRLHESFHQPLHSFSVGMAGAPDLRAAKKVADFLGTIHHECLFTIQEGLDAIPDVIYHLETYDVTTIRSGTPMFLLSRQIKATGIKMVLSGEGSDEAFGGYLYFAKAPTPDDFHRECVDRLLDLNVIHCLRANKATMAWGLELRVPFLDREFLDSAMAIEPTEKMCPNDGGRMEKYILRKAFDTPDDPYLPHSILWRQKEQFSDGVGYSWIDSLRQNAENQVSDDEFAQRFALYPVDTPQTKEALYYRRLFEEYFPGESCRSTVRRWIRAEWAGKTDPSGRAQSVHVDAYDHSTMKE